MKTFVATSALLLFSMSTLAFAQADSFKITSPAFSQNQTIPREYTADGAGISPPLQWTSVPEGTKELVLIMEDPDAPKTSSRPGSFIHWIVYDISPVLSELPQGHLPPSVMQGKNSTGKEVYTPPSPPAGDPPHHYQFKLFALDQSVSIKPGATEDQVLSLIQGHILGESTLVGTYGRKQN